jgi:hypothetical protein
VIPPETAASRLNVAIFPALHRNFKPLTGMHAMTYCPPSQGLKQRSESTMRASLLEE